MLICNKTVTLVNTKYDPEADIDVPHETTLNDVSWCAALKAAPTKNGLQSACLYRCRIPAALCEGYLRPEEWDAEPSEHWTLRPGDTLRCDGVTATVLAVHDNRTGRANPHVYVEAS